MQQYSAFTVSSQLTYLRIAADPPGYKVDFARPLPVGAVQHIFPAGKQLSRLKQLHFGVGEHYGIDDDGWNEDSHYMELLGPGDLALVAAACPALERFWAIAAVQKDAQLADLAKMTSVTQLAIGGNHLEAAELAAAVAKMTQLQDLSVVGMPDFGPTAAAPLTQLTALRRLRLWACYMEDCTFACEELLTSKVRKAWCAIWVQLQASSISDSRLMMHF
jgi:hypothetical protein